MTLPENPIVVGCNYHTTWQKHKAMRFVLGGVTGDLAFLYTRTTKKTFTTHVRELIFIQSKHNRRKALEILKNEQSRKAIHAQDDPEPKEPGESDVRGHHDQVQHSFGLASRSSEV